MKSGFSDWNQPVGVRKEPTCAPRVLFGEQVHEPARLLECRPEDHDEREDHEDHAQAVLLDLRQRVLGAARHPEGTLRRRLAADVADVALREGELDDHGKQHADAGREEADAPAVGGILAERRADERCEEGAGVDAHVEDDECAVAPPIALRIQVADHRRDVRLEEPVAEDEQQQADVETRRRVGEGDAEDRKREGAGHAHRVERRREYELPGRHHEAADDHGLALAEEVVGEPAAEERRQVNEARVPGVKRERLAIRPAEAGVHGVGCGGGVEHEQCPHAVVAEALPHLRDEQEIQALRMAEESPRRDVQVIAHAALLRSRASLRHLAVQHQAGSRSGSGGLSRMRMRHIRTPPS